MQPSAAPQNTQVQAPNQLYPTPQPSCSHKITINTVDSLRDKLESSSNRTDDAVLRHRNWSVGASHSLLGLFFGTTLIIGCLTVLSFPNPPPMSVYAISAISVTGGFCIIIPAIIRSWRYLTS